jgi:poly(A) polymerase
MAGMAEVGYRSGADIAKGIYALRCAISGAPPLTEMVDKIDSAGHAVFPIKAVHLQDEFIGPALGQRLKELEVEWIASDFSKTKTQLLG